MSPEWVSAGAAVAAVIVSVVALILSHRNGEDEQ